jgi:tetratricopeptide (TPR) repeat protein
VNFEMKRGSLDVAGFMEGTAKSSLWVDILRHYERHFSEFRDSDIEILEIGVFNGSSLELWKQYFTKARFIGVDILPACKSLEDDRVSIEIGSQDDSGFLLGLTEKYHPTIIIDDGSHLAHHVKFTFEKLFPSLPPGGLYVIEDMFVHLKPRPNTWLGETEISPPDYLFDAVRFLFTERTPPSVDQGPQEDLRNSIEEIAFAPLGVSFIRKNSAPIPINDRISLGEEYARRRGQADLWWRLAEYGRRNAGPLDRAEAAARNAIAIAPRSAESYRVLSLLLRMQGDVDGAISAAEKAVEFTPDNWIYWHFLGQLYFSTRDFPRAEDCFRKAETLRDHDPEIRQRLNQALAAQGKPEEVN